MYQILTKDEFSQQSLIKVSIIIFLANQSVGSQVDKCRCTHRHDRDNVRHFLCDFCETCLKAVSMHCALEWTFLRLCTDMTFVWFLNRTF
jgi:hypothetical protein